MARRRSLRFRLSVAFAAVAVLGALAIGAVLVPLLSGHYSMAEQAYLEAAAERSVRDLSTMSWKDQEAITAEAVSLAAVTQARVTLTNPKGVVVAEIGPPSASDPPSAEQPLPNPLGVGLFGEAVNAATLPRSDKSVERPVQKPASAGSGLVGYVRISDAPAFEQVALLNALEAWALASLVGVLAAALAGIAASAWLSRPLRELTVASDRMAAGDLSVRAEVGRDDEIGQLATSFNAMAGRVDETVGSLRRFVADAAHEIGTPLTALQADLELADAHAQSPDERRLIGRALGQAERLGVLSADLLRLSRLEAMDALPEPERVDLAALCRQLADAIASRADQAGIEVVLDLPDAPVPVVANLERLRTAIGYLLDNALKFTPADGTVTIALRTNAADGGRGRGEAVLSVSDTGIGIPPDDLPGLFERFHRGRNAAGYPGSGLGLAIVRATAEVHGGSVRAESSGAGSRFELRLPLAGPEVRGAGSSR